MIFDVYNPHDNQEVTQEYVRIIEEALQRAGHTTQHIRELETVPENGEKGVITIQTSATIRAKKAGYRYVIRWMQGVVEAESFMRNHSWLRYYVIGHRVKRSFACSDVILFCSQTMKDHYTKKFRKPYDNSYIMPCFNEELHKEPFYTPGKYEGNVFVYAGSLARWQCFEPTVQLYREVEKQVDNCTLHVLVKDRETAEEILKQYGVERYSIDYVAREEVTRELENAKFGFCVREDDIVNRVATPTKLSNYISNGVLPVYSSYLESFHALAKDCPYCVCADMKDAAADAGKLAQLCARSQDPDTVYQVFADTFGRYYSREHYVEELTALFKERFTN